MGRETSVDDYRTFSTMPRNSNHYLPIFQNLASTSLSSLARPLKPTSPSYGRRTSPKKTPSPQRKSRSSTSTSVFGKVMERLKINSKGRKTAPKSPLRSPGLRGKRSFSGVGRWEEHSPQRLHQERLAELRRLRAERRAIEMNAEDRDRHDDAQAQYLTTLWITDPFKTPPCTPTDAPPLSPVEMNGAASDSPDSARSRKRQAEKVVQVQRSGMKLLQTLGLDAREAVLEQCRKALEV